MYQSTYESIKSLMESSDEPETRQAWMEHIADMSQCPECEGKIGVVERSWGLNYNAQTSLNIFAGHD